MLFDSVIKLDFFFIVDISYSKKKCKSNPILQIHLVLKFRFVYSKFDSSSVVKGVRPKGGCQ